MRRINPPRHKWVPLLTAVLLAGLGIVVIRITRPVPEPAFSYESAPTPTATVVSLSTVQRAQVDRELEVRGRVSPVQEADLYFPMEGWLKEVHVALGQQVQKGDLLAELDAWQLESQLVEAQHTLEMRRLEISRTLAGPEQGALAVAQAKVERARVALARAELEATQGITQTAEALAEAKLRDAQPELEAAEVGLERAKIKLDEAQDAYTQSLDRPWEDVKIHDAIAKELELAKLDYRLAQAALETAQMNVADWQLTVRHAQQELDRSYDTAKQRVAEAKTDLALAEAELAQLTQPVNEIELQILRARVAKAEVDLQRLEERMAATRIYALFDGTLFALDVQVGDQVQAYTPVGTLGDPSDVQVVAYVFEQDIGGVSSAQPATVLLDSYPDDQYVAHVQQVAVQPVTWQGKRAYPITIAFDQADEVPSVLRTGCDVYIHAGVQSDVLTVPERALYWEGSLTYVDVVEGEQVRRTSVRVGMPDGDRIEILSGLREGQLVRVY